MVFSVRRKGLLLLLVVFLTACSFKASYRYMDWLIPWYIDDYVELDERQKAFLLSELNQLKRWHQQHELVRYRDYVAQLQILLKQPQLSIQQINAQTEQLEGLSRALLRQIIPALSGLLEDLTPSQRQQMLNKFKTELKQEAEKARARQPDEWLEYRYDRWHKPLKRWLGSSTKQQRQLIKTFAQQTPQAVEAYIAYYLRRLEYLTQSLSLEQPDMRVVLETFLNDSERFSNPKYRKHQQLRSANIANLYRDLHATMTPRQHAHLQQQLQNWRDDFQDLLDDN